MAVTTATFKVTFPTFQKVSDDLVQFWLNKAALRINRTAWGAKADCGTEFLAAHLLTKNLEAYQGDVGAVTQESVGDISVSYGVGTSVQDWELASTAYGRMYLDICREIFAVRCL